MTHLDLVSLRLFVSVVEQRSIAQASRTHNIAASAVSKRLSDLEARVGVTLLYRLKEGVEPTPAGQALYRHAKRMTRIVEDLEAELSEYSQGARGHVRLWANTSAVTQFLPEDLAAYVAHFPEVRIELREDTSNRIVDAVRDGFADMGVFSDHIGPTDLETRIYRRDTLMLIVPSGHPLAGRERVRLAETAAFDHVGLQEGSSLQARLLEEAGRDGTPIRMRVQVFGFDGIRRMVEAGLGIAVLPQGAVLPYLGKNEFCAVELDESWAVRSLLLGFREYRSLPIVARALIECLAPDEAEQGQATRPSL
ncbi:LysR family transcriptional regulator [Mycobacterium sp. KBS0706]|uniref:LysR substrate-binding domain-containing protein n=1 Tax=Mycobacterium sp. KBS0706 TaxID=2578109 RepID=UPI00110FBE1C|nr:LysR substrate-binding domain-containing protein [Mycobacterium sp. KBS0706]TSD83488.1 LysR family transcriptional regulator [Mycobacterium sp. KBS0706]